MEINGNKKINGNNYNENSTMSQTLSSGVFHSVPERQQIFQTFLFLQIGYINIKAYCYHSDLAYFYFKDS